MKFFDAFRIALHNLWQNKSRTILTIIIVLVVSALIMAMCLIGTNFISNNERMLKMMLDTDGSTYYISGTYDEGGSRTPTRTAIPRCSRRPPRGKLRMNTATP